MIRYSGHAGYLLVVCYEISIHTHFLTSLNRFSAVFFPFSYKSTFSIRATSIYLIVIAIFSFSMMTFVIYGLDCKLEYDPTTWVAFYDVTIPVCGWYAYYADFLKNVVVVLADAIIDITFGQGICYLMGYASYLVVPMNSNKYVAFFMSLVGWALIAMIDGLFTIVYNSEIRTKILRKKETFVGSTVVSVNN
ncbi:hypothetical protein GCK72_018054 [Caenorhabditis remanei]|uniref:7TM GPCR serpentine receptor class x (Srx) domain-containing protein n=1 Tax=Caenorhabditis remanei TaxID=31234 RepID=A0A6A5G932_CAERE|nr:hypothetical protein GCK72_018054 [Caenorhabditis remanei]KAF1751500.1 hypothetical protein GCK72_018054 [Caenorhabditis remanei]